MPKILLAHPYRQQIKLAKENDLPICFDLRAEAMGDKVAALGFAEWVHSTFDVPVIFVEARNGRTPFMLSDYVLPDYFTVEEKHLHEEPPYLDVYRGGSIDPLWIVTPYLRMLGIHPSLQLRSAPKKAGDIIFSPLTGVAYNERRNMSLECVSQTVEHLRADGYSVTVLYDKQSDELPDAMNLPLNTAIERIASASLFIGGDTGFTHLACALGVPTIALYPDWGFAGMTSTRDNIVISEWLEIPAYYIGKNFLPSAPYDKIRVSEIDTEHKWSIEHVKKCARSLFPQPTKSNIITV